MSKNDRVASSQYRRVLKSDSDINKSSTKNRMVLNDIKNSILQNNKLPVRRVHFKDDEENLNNVGQKKENIPLVKKTNETHYQTSSLKTLSVNLPKVVVRKEHSEKKIRSYQESNTCTCKTSDKDTTFNKIVFKKNLNGYELREVINGNFLKSSPFKYTNPSVKEKKKVLRKRENGENSESNSNVLVLEREILFQEYIHDIIKHLLTFDRTYVLPLKFFKNKGNSGSKRFETILWIFQNKQLFYLTSSTYLIVVRFFDNILGRIQVPEQMYRLIAITLIWIITKAESPMILNLKSLEFLVNHRFEKYEILKMEQKLLKLFNFSFHSPVELDYSFYYLHHLNKYKNYDFQELLHASVIILLEIFSLSEYFSTFSPSELGAATVHLSLGLLSSKNKRISQQLDKLEGFPNEPSLLKSEIAILEALKHIHQNNYIKILYPKNIPSIYKTAIEKLKLSLELNNFSVMSILRNV